MLVGPFDLDVCTHLIAGLVEDGKIGNLIRAHREDGYSLLDYISLPRYPTGLSDQKFYGLHVM